MSWTHKQKMHGATALQRMRASQALDRRLKTLARTVESLLTPLFSTEAGAADVWSAVPLVLSQCNNQATYAQPGSAPAYAWLHLLDRYARTWRGLEVLLEHACLPLGSRGVDTLDIGTGPGPSAFATHDFYSELYLAAATELAMPTPPCRVTCIEFDRATNSLRHQLAELIAPTLPAPNTILSLCSAIPDFHDVDPPNERAELLRRMRRDAEDNEDATTAAEFHGLASSIHRYRLFLFSNFLTTLGTVQEFRRNIVSVLRDAHPGSVVLVFGGSGGQYQEIYRELQQLTNETGFTLAVEGVTVSAADTGSAHDIFEHGRHLFGLLQRASPNIDSNSEPVRKYFAGDKPAKMRSIVWAFRKRR